MAQTTTQSVQQAPPARRMGDFNRATRQSIIQLPDQTYPGTAGQITRLDLPQTGFLGALWLKLVGTTTTAAASTTTVGTYPGPMPANFIRRIRVYNNQGVELVNVTGFGLYLYNATLRTGFDQAVDHADFSYGAASNPFARYFAGVSSLAASSTETWRFAWCLPIAWGFSLQAGLQLLQDPAIRYTMEITWGDATDLYSATTGTVTLSGVTLKPTIELYHVPAQAIDLPRLSYSKTILEDLQALTAGTGENTYKFVTGNLATRIIQEFSNAPAGVRAAILPASITQRRLRYSQTQIPYDQDPDTVLFRQRLLYGRDLPAGVYVDELSDPMGLPELVGTRDIINTARLTDMDIITTLSGVTLATGQMRTIREQLVANR
jgi:hypothetical protein